MSDQDKASFWDHAASGKPCQHATSDRDPEALVLARQRRAAHTATFILTNAHPHRIMQHNTQMVQHHCSTAHEVPTWYVRDVLGRGNTSGISVAKVSPKITPAALTESSGALFGLHARRVSADAGMTARRWHAGNVLESPSSTPRGTRSCCLFLLSILTAVPTGRNVAPELPTVRFPRCVPPRTPPWALLPHAGSSRPACIGSSGLAEL